MPAKAELENGRSNFELPAAVNEARSRRWTEAEAFAYCTSLTKSHYENFPVGSALAPRRLQPAIHSLYAFMRTADDFADENRSVGDESERMRWLQTWDRMLADCTHGDADHPVFIALAATLRRYQLPVEWLRDLLRAFMMDVTIRRYSTYADVLEYCRYSANPVGRLILTLFGYRDEERYRLSDSICTALQLANHWQDVAVDLKKDRIYLPQEDLRRFGVSEEQLRQGEVNRDFRSLLREEVRRARELFANGRPLPEKVRGRLRYELRMTWHGGSRILDKIEANGYDVFRNRPEVTKADWAWLAVRSALNI